MTASIYWFVEAVEDLVILAVLFATVRVAFPLVPRRWRIPALFSVGVSSGLMLMELVPDLPPALLVVHETIAVGIIASTAALAWNRHGNALRSTRSRNIQRDKADALLSTAPGLLTVRSPDGVVIDMNDAVARLVGVSRDELDAHDWHEMVDPEVAAEQERDFSAWVAAGCPGEPTAEYPLNDAEGCPHWVAWRRRAVFAPDGSIDCIVSGGLDITARRAAELAVQAQRDELEVRFRKRTEDVRAAVNELQTALEARDLFFAGASHELRSPLNSVIGFSGVLLTGAAGELSDEQRKQVSMIRRSGDDLLRLVNDLLDVSQSVSGKLRLEAEDVDVCDILRSVVREHAGSARAKGLRLSLECGDEPVLAHTDGLRLRQVVENLVSNAVKYTEHGSVIVRLFPGSGSEADDHLCVSVTDTGSGIDASDMSDLFEPFSRFRMAGDSAQHGNGLGLYVTRRLLRLLGGDVSVESEARQGSCFTASFARRLGSEQDAAPR